MKILILTLLCCLMLSCDNIEDTSICIPGEAICNGSMLAVCNSNEEWEMTDCSKTMCTGEFCSMKYTCCTLEGNTGCHLEISCKLYNKMCNAMTEYVELYCEEY